MIGVNRIYKKDGIALRSVHKDIDLFGYAVDEHLKEYVIMHERNGEWTPAPITKKFGVVTTPVIAGSTGNADSGYAYLGTLSAEPEALGFRYRIDAKDHAGNVVSVSSPLPPEEGGLYDVLSDKFPYGNPLLLDPEKTQITTIKLALTEVFAADGNTLCRSLCRQAMPYVKKYGMRQFNIRSPALRRLLMLPSKQVLCLVILNLPLIRPRLFNIYSTRRTRFSCEASLLIPWAGNFIRTLSFLK